jgi:hypothetical protein
MGQIVCTQRRFANAKKCAAEYFRRCRNDINGDGLFLSNLTSYLFISVQKDRPGRAYSKNASIVVSAAGSKNRNGRSVEPSHNTAGCSDFNDLLEVLGWTVLICKLVCVSGNG